MSHAQDQRPASPLVGIIMGSDSDLPVMQEAATMLQQLGVAYEMTIVSAHRTPGRLYEYAQSARGRGIRVIIAGAGGAAHRARPLRDAVGGRMESVRSARRRYNN